MGEEKASDWKLSLSSENYHSVAGRRKDNSVMVKRRKTWFQSQQQKSSSSPKTSLNFNIMYPTDKACLPRGMPGWGQREWTSIGWEHGGAWTTQRQQSHKPCGSYTGWKDNSSNYLHSAGHTNTASWKRGGLKRPHPTLRSYRHLLGKEVIPLRGSHLYSFLVQVNKPTAVFT